MRHILAFVLCVLASFSSASAYWYDDPAWLNLRGTNNECNGTTFSFRLLANKINGVESWPKYTGGCSGLYWRDGIQIPLAEFLDALGKSGFSPCQSYQQNCGWDNCPAVDAQYVGQNCCSVGLFGATWYVGKDANNCDVLKCNTSACHGCGPPPSTAEGTACSCGAGEGTGVTTWTYDGNGCPTGTACDDCEPCEDISEYLNVPCMAENGEEGTTVSAPGPDGCPMVKCSADPISPCELDSNRDGTPDYLEGNAYKDAAVGSSCVCSNDKEGTIEMRENGDGCPVPTCSCEDECTAGDRDGDGCCDDEDPDPEDPNKNCDDCSYQWSQKVTEIVLLFRNKIGLPGGGAINKDWEFAVDLGSVKDSWYSAFGIKFGGNLTTGNFWLNQPGGPVRPEQGTMFGEVLLWRDKVRNVLVLCAYLIFARLVLAAVFDTAR